MTGSADGNVRVWVSSFFLSFFCFLFPAFLIEGQDSGDKRFRGFIFILFSFISSRIRIEELNPLCDNTSPLHC